MIPLMGGANGVSGGMYGQDFAGGHLPSYAGPTTMFGTGQGNAPAPSLIPSSPTAAPAAAGVPASLIPPAAAPAPAAAPMAAPAPSAAPAPAPATAAAAVPTPSLTNASTGQTVPDIGTPTGYNVSAGIDSSAQALLPSSFNVSALTSPQLPDATTPGASSYASEASSQLAGPTSWNLTPQDTVAGQYASLMSTGSPAIQAAEQATIRANASNGGNNSLMAQTAATLAGSQVALTIAQQDAQMNAANGQFNASAANTFATAQNAFIHNATLSEQNFNQGVAMLKDQTNQSITQLYAQVEAHATESSVALKAQLATTQASSNATLEQMDKAFVQNTATAATAESNSISNAWTQYGMNVRMSYLGSVTTQQNALMNTIGAIGNNPNINTAQADSAVKQAVDQFNSFMTMNNAYYSAMVPSTKSPGYYPPGFPNS